MLMTAKVQGGLWVHNLRIIAGSEVDLNQSQNWEQPFS